MTPEFRAGEQVTDTVFDRYVEAVERIIGCGVDDDKANAEGFCLDLAGEAFDAGKSPADYVAWTRREFAHLAQLAALRCRCLPLPEPVNDDCPIHAGDDDED